MTVKRRRGGVPLTKTQKRIIAGTAAVAATVGGLYALYRKRKSLKAVMKPRVQKLTPEQRETFVKESHKRKLPGKTADEVVERADEAVREARRAAATRRRRQAKRGRTTKRAKRKRSSSGIGYVGGAVSVIVLGVLAAYAVATKSGMAKSGEEKSEEAKNNKNKSGTLYFEKQTGENCAIHAINNLLQSKVVTQEDMDSYAKNPVHSKLGNPTGGMYRIDTIMGILQNKTYGVCSNETVRGPQKKLLFDLAVNTPGFIGIIVHEKARVHYTCYLYYLNSQWVYLDSLKHSEGPRLINDMNRITSADGDAIIYIFRPGTCIQEFNDIITELS